MLMAEFLEYGRGQLFLLGFLLLRHCCCNVPQGFYCPGPQESLLMYLQELGGGVGRFNFTQGKGCHSPDVQRVSIKLLEQIRVGTLVSDSARGKCASISDRGIVMRQ